MDAWTLNVDFDAPYNHGRLAQISAHATAIGIYLTRMSKFPPDISACFLLAVLEGPEAIIDFPFVSDVAPGVADHLGSWSDDIGDDGPYRNLHHPHYRHVRTLVALFTEADVREMCFLPATSTHITVTAQPPAHSKRNRYSGTRPSHLSTCSVVYLDSQLCEPPYHTAVSRRVESDDQHPGRQAIRCALSTCNRSQNGLLTSIGGGIPWLQSGYQSFVCPIYGISRPMAPFGIR